MRLVVSLTSARQAQRLPDGTRTPVCRVRYVERLCARNYRQKLKTEPETRTQSQRQNVCHHRNLQFDAEQGLVVTKIHRVIAFDQNPWLKPWIDYCTTRRQMACTEFESDLAKLQANTTFGKTIDRAGIE